MTQGICDAADPHPVLSMLLSLNTRASSRHGLGVFATAPIRRHALVIEYAGELITHAEAERRYPTDRWAEHPEHTYVLQLDEERVVDANVRGNDSFTFRVSDGLASAVGTVNLKVRPVNDAPVANAAMLSVAEDTPLLGQLTGSDVETPAELEQVYRAKGGEARNLRSSIRQYLIEMGWTAARIAESFIEVRRALGE
jgi:hypothetical protein